MVDQLDCALDLMRRMPPSQIEDNLAGLIDLVPHLTEQLLSAVDQPLKIAHDPHSKKDYLLCDYNRDGDSYRVAHPRSSPWSNRYDPPLDDGAAPSPELRKVEVQANEVFDIYRELDTHKQSAQDTSKRGQPMKGTWDAIHVVEVRDNKKSAHYKLTSTIMLSIETKADATGAVNLAGSLTRQAEQDFPVNDHNPHVSNIGRMLEDMELKLRNTIEFIYFGKTKDVVNELRSAMGAREAETRKKMQQQLAGGAASGRPQ